MTNTPEPQAEYTPAQGTPAPVKPQPSGQQAAPASEPVAPPDGNAKAAPDRHAHSTESAHVDGSDRVTETEIPKGPHP